MKPLIGITAGHVLNQKHPHSPYTYAQLHTYCEAVRQEGGIPVILPISKNAEQVKDIFERLDGVMFAGGNDISSKLYGEEPRDIRDSDEERDTHEVTLMKMCLAVNKPILTICRGMQMLNALRGGTLYQDIVTDVPGATNHDGHIKTGPERISHTLQIVPDTSLAGILGVAEIHANSYHHQAIKDLGDGLTINARAEDGIIEGVEDMRHGYIMAVQPHPESMAVYKYPEWRPLFQSFVHAAAEQKS
jgi:putative glutamine amidotransferase